MLIILTLTTALGIAVPNRKHSPKAIQLLSQLWSQKPHIWSLQLTMDPVLHPSLAGSSISSEVHLAQPPESQGKERPSQVLTGVSEDHLHPKAVAIQLLCSTFFSLTN